MSEVYQPVIIRELLMHGGTCSKQHLAARLADHDESVQDYYQRILMRYPKETLTKHAVVAYDRATQSFELTADFKDGEREELIALCERKINDWLDRRTSTSTGVPSSLRHEVLKAARAKCQLCGIPASLRPIDVDHIVPKSRKNRYGKVVVNGRAVDVNSIDNLQALCMTCNRGKRDGDDTDWRKHDKLVRDRIPALMVAEGKSPYVVQLKGSKLKEALREKLIEEVGEYLDSGEPEELADILEVVRAIADQHGMSAADLDVRREKKRSVRGGFDGGWFYSTKKS